MDLKEILDFSRPADEVIKDLRVVNKDVEPWSKIEKDYYPEKHRICTDNRRDKIRGDGGVEKASSIHLGLEQLIVRRMSEFIFGIPVKRVYYNADGERQKIVDALERIYQHARIDAMNYERSKYYFASCEASTLWYSVEKENTFYGFPSKYKLKCANYSPMNGYEIYPLFDEMSDLVAISFEYQKTIADKRVSFFETFTEDRHILWKNEDGWKVEIDAPLKIGKIPIIYIQRSKPLFYGLSHIREEVEYTLSRNSDVVAYNCAPILKVSGLVSKGENKGEARRIYRTENGGDVSYVSWSQANEALKYHVDTLLKMFFMQSQLPDISFDAMKSLGSIGYDARQTLFMDAHLRVRDEQGAFIEFLDREMNVVKAFLKQANTEWSNDIDDIEVEHVITPYVQNDIQADIVKWTTACGGKPIMSQLEAIKQFGYSDDAEETLRQIQQENINENIETIFQ